MFEDSEDLMHQKNEYITKTIVQRDKYLFRRIYSLCVEGWSMTKVFINGEFIDQNELKYLMKTVVMYLVMEFMNTLEHMMGNYLQ